MLTSSRFQSAVIEPAARKEPMVWAMVTQWIEKGVRKKGMPPEPLFARYGIDIGWLADPYRELPLRTHVQIFEEAAVYTRDADFGLFAGRDYSPFDMGPVGLLFASSANLGMALRSVAAHVGVMQQETQTELVEGDDMCAFRYRIAAPRVGGKRQDAEFTLVTMLNLIHSLVGKRWRPAEVHFEHHAPPSLQGHARMFGAPIYFDQPTNALVFPATDLATRGGVVDDRVNPIASHHLDVLRRKQVAVRSLADQVGSIIDEYLPGTGQHLTAASAARSAGVSLRTLYRALAQKGVSFKGICDEKRQVLARSLLAYPDLSITEIAFMLNYADAACFTRACRRWFGVTPSAYRRQLLATGPAEEA